MATLSSFGGATALVLIALQDNVTYYYTPSELTPQKTQERIRIGGFVQKGSVVKASDHIQFIVTDTKKHLTVQYAGVVPDLFRDGQGVIVEGKLQSTTFIADRLLAKHDENYKPPITGGKQ